MAHDRWATGQILAACEALTREQFHKRFEIGPGSLHDTTTHIVGSMKRWNDFLAGRGELPRLEGPERTIEEITSLLDEVAGEFAALVRSMPEEAMVSGKHSGREFTLSCGVVLSHVMVHGTHHRAQCVNMLRHSGVKELPNTSVRGWMMATAPA